VVDQTGLLTVKGITVGATRAEFEYEIPVADARVLLDELCERPLIEKTRHLVVIGARTWEIDEFSGANAGLVVAEIELDEPDEPIDFPAWVGPEVTDDPRYFNSNLIAHPFAEW
jgi:CYTH domain-containing protein